MDRGTIVLRRYGIREEGVLIGAKEAEDLLCLLVKEGLYFDMSEKTLKISERDARIFSMRYGLNGFAEHRNVAVSREVGLSPSWIQAITGRVSRLILRKKSDTEEL